VEFRLGEIERLPINDNTVDVVVSNCVMNLVPDKNKAFAETYRIIKPGGHFSISDIVLEGELPEDLRHEAELYAGCVAGALQKSEYLDAIRNAGFVNVTIQKERAVDIPDEIRARQRALELQGDYRTSKLGIFSITVFGEKAK
jgi:SAM-dependent methyltransferase